ncbi:glycosyltransferase [Obesumbacterium proteus]|uniref:Putative glycosyltransferase EpsJ n=1 Tax=Hafnia alvei TaxID=569 RepID=A0A172X0D9_HAFAL|nr:putative glycosyltransferase EpsJ [Hafnia alvei]TBL48087.1 glycosyltransferase [Obesumbacterium proteus]
MILLSIIIPVYNVDEYVAECIDSLLCNLSEALSKKIEIIIIDDGSTDNSWNIISEYANSLTFMQCWRKSNGGLSDARNYGIRKSIGRYLAFIDSDDIVSERFIPDLIQFIESNSFDLLSFNYKKFVHKPQFEIDTSEQPKSRVVDKYFYVDKALFAWNKVYSRKIFDNLYFTVGLYYEDVALIPLLIDKADVIRHIDFCYYGYRQRASSITYRTDDKYLDILKSISIIYNESDSNFIKNIVMNQFFTLTFITLRSPMPKAIDNLKKISSFYKKNFIKEKFKPSLLSRQMVFYVISKLGRLYIPMALFFKPIVLIHLMLKKTRSTL